MHPLNFIALRNIELASFLRWYVTVELNDPAYAKRFYCTYEILEDNMMKVWVPHFSLVCHSNVYLYYIFKLPV